MQRLQRVNEHKFIAKLFRGSFARKHFQKENETFRLSAQTKENIKRIKRALRIQKPVAFATESLWTFCIVDEFIGLENSVAKTSRRYDVKFKQLFSTVNMKGLWTMHFRSYVDIINLSLQYAFFMFSIYFANNLVSEILLGEWICDAWAFDFLLYHKKRIKRALKN